MQIQPIGTYPSSTVQPPLTRVTPQVPTPQQAGKGTKTIQRVDTIAVAPQVQSRVVPVFSRLSPQELHDLEQLIGRRRQEAAGTPPETALLAGGSPGLVVVRG